MKGQRMVTQLRILLVEDSPDDADLVLHAVRQAGFTADSRRVEREPDFLAGLEWQPDIILSDYSMPQFSGLEAAHLLQQSGLDIPFILISGTVGEDVAVEAMKHGATDYLLKDRIARLGPAIQRALNEKRLRDERREAQKEKAKKEEQVRQLAEIQTAILNALPAHIALLDPAGIIVNVNESWRQFAADNLLPGAGFGVGQNYLAVCEQARGECADEARTAAAGIRRILSGESREFLLEYPCHSPAEQRWFQLIATPLHRDRQAGAVVMHVNITKRKLAELALARSQAEMVAAQRIAHFGSWETDLVTLKTVWSEETHRIFETDPASFLPTHQRFLEFVHPEDQAAVDDAFYASLTRRGTNLIEHRLKLPNGRVKYIEERWQCYQNDQGKPLRAIGTCQDITERKRAELARRESEEKFRQLAENINEVFWITEPGQPQMLYVSPAYEKIWGRSCASLYESPGSWLESIHPDDRQRVSEAAAVKHTSGDYEEIYRILRPDGSLRWIHDRAFPIFNDAGKVYRLVGTAEDITDKRRLEEQLRQAQKMEAIGQLAGGVAHDFNNILAVIQMQAGIMRLDHDLSPEHKDYAVEIEKAAQRGANLTRQLLLFSRRQVMQLGDVDLNEIVTNITKMLQRILGENIRLQFKLAPGPLLIHADAGMMDQVLMNLVVNGRDAMPKGGQLVIETSGAEFDQDVIAKSSQVRPGSFVCLSVTDTGSGIPPEVLPRIFDPFFTTKHPGKGTGLGLATVFGIVQQHKGWIDVYSEIGHGTTMRVYLPRLTAAKEKAAPSSAAGPVRGGNETILLVEDERALRQSAQSALSRLGYRVLEAGDADEAQKLWQRHREEIQLLITDLIMPGERTGKELASCLLKQNPKLQVLFVSGYSAEVASDDPFLSEGVNFLTKPFPALKLARLVRERLDAKNAP
jgi:PAS domain S-box-containing protein